MWDLIVSVPDHYLSFYFYISTSLTNQLVPHTMIEGTGRFTFALK